MVDLSGQGGWIGPNLCAVKPVAKDYVRYSKQDAQTLLSNLMDTLRTPGSRANLLSRPVKTWLTSVIQEDAVRVEYTEEDVNNAINPREPAMDAAKKCLNVLQYAFELRIAQLFDPSTFASANKTAATGLWAGSTGKIIYDIERSVATVAELSGVEPNFIRIPRKKLAGMLASDEMLSNNQGVYLDILRQVVGGGLPSSIAGLKILIGTVRQDTAPTGTFTPAFIWDSSTYNLDDTVHIGYSPVLAGGSWDGSSQAFVGSFENQINGSAFTASEYLSPYYQEDGVHIVHANFRRSLPAVINADLCFALTGI